MRFWASISLGLLMSLAAFAQAPNSGRRSSSTAEPRKVNELTLAALRPGRDFAVRAVQLFGKPDLQSADRRSMSWGFEGADGAFYLNLDVDKMNVVQSIRVSHGDGPSGVMLPKHTSFSTRSTRTWGTGRGLRVWDPAPRVVQLYGEPDSRSPSTKDGRKLELLYYAFDWAGTDVPQVMEVLCTVEHDSNPGRVVEITLAAPSL